MVENRNRTQLAQAYQATAYCVEIAGDELRLRIGKCSSPLDRLLDAHDAQTWAIITADNPQSIRQAAEQNLTARASLAEHVQREGYRNLSVIARADAGNWPDEHGLLILAITRQTSVALARQFDQAAVVYGRRGGAPELVFCDS